MKKIAVISIVSCFALASQAQVRMRDVFAQLPDSVLSLVTRNNRLDCIDFMEYNMQARVKNMLGEMVELKTLADDYLLFETSPVASVEMKLFSHSNETFLCVNRICRGPVEDSELRIYDLAWKLLSRVHPPKISDFLQSPDPNSNHLHPDTIDLIRSEAEYLPLIKASLSSGKDEIRWTLQTGEFSKDIKKVADKYLQPVVTPIPKP